MKTTNYFVLKTDGLYWVKDMPDIKEDRDHFALIEEGRAAIASSIMVSSKDEVIKEIELGLAMGLNLGEIYQLECEVKLVSECDTCACHAPGCSEKKFEAFVTLPGKEETKEPCPNCKELIEDCACMRNICHKCSKPVGNITFSVCDDCWDEKHGKQGAVTKEEEQTIFLVKDHNGVTYGAYRTKLKAESSITDCEDEYFIIEQELH